MTKPCYCIFIVFFTAFFLSGCQNELTLESPELYSKLCDIYERVDKREIDNGLKDGLIVKEIQDNIPVYFEKNYHFIMSMDRDKRYPTMRRLAEEALGEDWDCLAMRSYYGID